MNRFLQVTRERKTWKTLLLNFVPFFKCLWHLFNKALWSITTYGTSSLSIHCYTHHKIVIISYFRDYNSKIICITDIRICIWRGCLFFLRLSLILVFDKYIFLPLILSSVLWSDMGKWEQGQGITKSTGCTRKRSRVGFPVDQDSISPHSINTI